MKVTLELTAQLRLLAPAPCLELELSQGASAADALAAAASQGSPELAEALLTGGQLAAGLVLAVDGRQVLAPDQELLTAGARLLVLSPIAGG